MKGRYGGKNFIGFGIFNFQHRQKYQL